MKIDKKILTIDQQICKNIEKTDSSERGFLSSNVLSHLRNFVEHIMLKIWKHPNDVDNQYDNIRDAISFVGGQGHLKFLKRFHNYLQIVASHYTPDEENSERLMLKYYEYLLKTKLFVKNTYGLEVLENIDRFPIDTDSGLREYHEKIAEKLDEVAEKNLSSQQRGRYYIHKIKPFFVAQKVYYEVTFIPAYGNSAKTDRVIAFTSWDITPFYAARLSIREDHIDIMGKRMPMFIITNWEVSIRPCELEHFSSIFGHHISVSPSNAEYQNLMQYITNSGYSLVEIVDLADDQYLKIKQQVLGERATAKFFPVLDRCRKLMRSSGSGSNILRYLLLRLNNKIIKDQIEKGGQNEKLSFLRLKNKCIPFDQMPFASSPINHNPKISDLFECLNVDGRKHELLARFIKNNSESGGNLYTSKAEVETFGDLGPLIQTYNDKLWSGHTGRKINESFGHLFISEYESNTLFALRVLKEKSATGYKNYSSSVLSWLDSDEYHVDCDEKRDALKEMFENSKVALIYGSAGTGKSTLINHISHFFAQYSKMYLANTNPAVDNLKRRVNAANCNFSTITKYLKNLNVNTDHDVLIIDECSTVSNQDIKDVLQKANYKALILVGDVFQIESIRFGNWFSAARSFIPETSVFELTKPYRSQDNGLLELWKRVRHKEDTLLEHITKKDFSRRLDSSIFEQSHDEEIILCLNYDGLYGINNINRFLQQNNQNPAVLWDIHTYKVNDPILFNETKRFAPLIYNNMKGKIVGIEELEEGKKIQFDVELDRVISGLDADPFDLVLLDNSENGRSVVRFTVNKHRGTDEDDDDSASDVVPFQVAYAVSIHKAQGLEYDSVKIVISKEFDELITHNIFYTAVTRARHRLKIYWSPEVENKIIENFSAESNNKDVHLLKQRDPSL